MSIEAMSWAMDQAGVAGSEKLVLIGIASHADKEGGNAYPSLATLARYASVDPRSVRRILRRLENAGYLRCDLNQGGSARCRKDKRPNLYELILSNCPEAQVSGGGRTQVSGGGRTQVSGGGRTQVSGGGRTQVSPESPIESPQERTPLPPAGGADGFDEVFEAYPRQVGRDKALQVWQAIKPDIPTRQQMLRSIKAWSRSQEWQRNEGQYVPRFTRWLSERRWLDVPGVVSAPARSAAPIAPSAPAVRPNAAVQARMNAILVQSGRRRLADTSTASMSMSAADSVELRA